MWVFVGGLTHPQRWCSRSNSPVCLDANVSSSRLLSNRRGATERETLAKLDEPFLASRVLDQVSRQRSYLVTVSTRSQTSFLGTRPHYLTGSSLRCNLYCTYVHIFACRTHVYVYTKLRSKSKQRGGSEVCLS